MQRHVFGAGDPSTGHAPVSSRSHLESARARTPPRPRKPPRPARNPDDHQTPSPLQIAAFSRAAPRFRHGRTVKRTFSRHVALPSRIRASANFTASAEAAAPCAKSGRPPPLPPNAFAASDRSFPTCSATFSARATLQPDMRPSHRAPISNPRERERRRVRGSRRALREIRTTTKRLHRFR